VDDFTRGWVAAARGEPFDERESEPWQAGYRLWGSHLEQKLRLAADPLSSVRLH
jgi:hypothetical protein